MQEWTLDNKAYSYYKKHSIVFYSRHSFHIVGDGESTISYLIVGTIFVNVLATIVKNERTQSEIYWIIFWRYLVYSECFKLQRNDYILYI